MSRYYLGRGMDPGSYTKLEWAAILCWLVYLLLVCCIEI